MSGIEQTKNFLMKERGEGSLAPWQLLGPLFLICTLGVAAGSAVPLDLLLMILAGFYLCARWHLRGYGYALFILGVGAAFRHALIDSHHLWYLGLEGSLACGFLITAFSFEQDGSLVRTLLSQIKTGTSTLQNLEEEISKLQEGRIAEQVHFQEKSSLNQKELEELQAEHSSILILNEVLRKTAAREAEENRRLAVVSLEAERLSMQAWSELEKKEKELRYVSQSEPLVIENKGLLEELNQARYDREQTRLISETLVRLHAKEVSKSKEGLEQIQKLTQERGEIEQQYVQIKESCQSGAVQIEKMKGELTEARLAFIQFNEVRSQKKFLQEQLLEASTKIDHLQQKIAADAKLRLNESAQWDEMQLHQSRLGLLSSLEAEREKKNLTEQLQLAAEEISSLKDQERNAKRQADTAEIVETLKKERELLAQQLAHAQEKLHALSQIEPLFKQFKKQFEEKNQILHQTRSELFKIDTELQALKIEKSQVDLKEGSGWGEELAEFDREIECLGLENQELLEVVTALTEQLNSSDLGSKPKKKVKTNSSPEQESLF